MWIGVVKIIPRIQGLLGNNYYFCKKRISMVEMVIKLEDESLLTPLRRVIQSLSGITQVLVRKDTQAKSEIYLRHQARIQELCSLKDDWDDEGAIPPEKQAISNIKRLLEKSNDSDLRQWVIFPDTNGTILLENKTCDATISIGCKEFSYISQHLRGSHEKATTANLLKIIRKING